MVFRVLLTVISVAVFTQANTFQGVIIKGFGNIVMKDPGIRIPNDAPLSVLAARCAVLAASRGDAVFELASAYRLPVQPPNPSTPDQLLNRTDDLFETRGEREFPREHVETVTCRSWHTLMVTAAASARKNPAYGFVEMGKVFTCYAGNCTRIEDFEYSPGVIKSKGTYIGADIGVSFEQCRDTVLQHNAHAVAHGKPITSLFSYGYSKPSQAGAEPPPRCWRATLNGSAPTSYKYNSLMGLLTPINPPPSTWFSLGSLWSSPAPHLLTNVSCSQKDLSERYSKDCMSFRYSIPQVGSPNTRTIPKEHLRLPSRQQAIYYTHLGERRALTFQLISQSTDKVLPTDLGHRGIVTTRLIGSDILDVFTAKEALEQCTLWATADMRRTINLVLSDRGWECTYYFEQLKDPKLLSEVNPKVFQSYLYSASLDSSRDPGLA